MKKLIIILLFSNFAFSVFAQGGYWSATSNKQYNNSYKDAFVTTDDQQDQFIIRVYENEKIDFFFVTEKNLTRMPV